MKETDYLIIGAGAMGMAFADEIFTKRPKAKLTIVDRRAKPGGHWNNAYPFVGLHQPAAFYGVNFMSHETMFKYFYYAAKAIRLSPGASKRAKELDEMLVA